MNVYWFYFLLNLDFDLYKIKRRIYLQLLGKRSLIGIEGEQFNKLGLLGVGGC